MRTIAHIGPLVVASVMVTPALSPVAHAAGGWSAAQRLGAPALAPSSPAPRAGIAADGTSAVAWSPKLGRLVVATGDRSGRFGAQRVLDGSGARDWSVAAAAGGAFAVAWVARDGVRVAVRAATGRRTVVRRVVARRSSEIDGVQIAADPRGGWVVAHRIFPYGPRRDRLYGVRALSLDRAGRRAGSVQDLGAGSFGIDARPTQALVVDAAGRALLTFQRDLRNFLLAVPAVVTTRPHGGAFSAPVEIGGPVADVHAAVGEGGRALVAYTRATSRGDAGSFGLPTVALLSPPFGLPVGPALARPNRAFAPTAAFTSGGRGVLVFQLKDRPAAFSREAPVRAVAFDAAGRLGAMQTLTRRRASEPVTMALSGGRALTVWTGDRGIDAAIAGPDGVFRKTAAPKAPPPRSAHFNATNRDLRTAGRFAIFTWERDGQVRVTVRRF